MSKRNHQITIKQVVEWLEGKRALFAKEFLTDDVIIIDAILAALEEKGGVSGEERKEALDTLDILADEWLQNSGLYGESPDEEANARMKPRIDKIRLLILGNQGGAVTEDKKK